MSSIPHKPLAPADVERLTQAASGAARLLGALVGIPARGAGTAAARDGGAR
ncbi:hypothetical protein ACFC1T_08730 [Kitasatospora sp. NPDC056076]|uniref:hypothetical protein n=1 Tax=Kitasatospora sp. NPDC056076 TaxID=3345703 RepID=UPI0035DE05CF